MGEQPKTHPNSEKKIENSDFQLKIGTTNNVKPEAVYIEGKTFIIPEIEKDYETDMKVLKHHLTNSVRKLLDSNTNLFDNKRYILDLDIATGGMMLGKKSFLTIQLMLKQNHSKILRLKDLKDKSSGAVNEMMYDLSKTIRNMNYFLTKSKD